MDVSDIIKKVKEIEIRSKLLSDQQFAGAYHTAFKGRGMQFSEVREYSYGDDVRHIDWNVSARMQDPYVKLFQEEREQTLIFMMDISPSVMTSIGQKDRRELIAEIIATLSFSANRTHDKIGLLLFDDEVRKYIPPNNGYLQILQIIREVLTISVNPKAKTNLELAVQYYRKIYKRNAVVFLLSDFLFDDYKDAVSALSFRNDLIGIAVKDPLDEMLPDIGLIQVLDAENQRAVWVDTSSKQYKEWYVSQAKYRKAYFKKVFSSVNASTIELSDQSDYVKMLQGFFRQRAKRR